MRPLPQPMPELDRRFVIRVPAQPYLRFDTNDYSLDPRLAGRRVEVRISQREVRATALDSGVLAARHRRCFARHLTFTDPAHQERSTSSGGSAGEVGERPRWRFGRWPATTP